MIGDALRDFQLDRQIHATRQAHFERMQRVIANTQENADELASSVQAGIKACGCLACPTCRPDIAHVAELVGKPFLSVLVYVFDAEGYALEQLVDHYGARQKTTRAERRRLARWDKKKAERAKRPG